MGTAVTGVVWSAVERFSVQGTQFLMSLVIARFVEPAEYGLIAMIAIFMAIAQTFVDSGFGNALIQKKDRSDIDYSTVFYFNIALSLLLYAGLYAAAPLVARFYEQPILVPVTRWVGLNLIFIAFSIVQRAKLTVDLDFRRQAEVSLLAVIISGVLGIYTAYIGWGVWALVVQTLSNNFFTAFFFGIIAKWKPLWVFSRDSFRKLFAFGSKLLASGLLQTVYLNLYSLVIGKWYNAADAGFYNRASSISQYSGINLIQVITRVLYPLQCVHQDDDDWLVATFPKFLRITCFCVFPTMACVAILSKPLVLIILSERWLPCARLISILCMAYIWSPIGMLNNHLINSKGRSDLFLKAEVIKKTTAVVVLIATLPFGLSILCWGVVIYNILDILIIIGFTRRILDMGFRKQLRAIAPLLSLTILASVAAGVLLPVFQSVWSQVCGGLAAFFLVFMGGAFLCGFEEPRMVISKVIDYGKGLYVGK